MKSQGADCGCVEEKCSVAYCPKLGFTRLGELTTEVCRWLPVNHNGTGITNSQVVTRRSGTRRDGCEGGGSGRSSHTVNGGARGHGGEGINTTALVWGHRKRRCGSSHFPCMRLVRDIQKASRLVQDRVLSPPSRSQIATLQRSLPRMDSR